MTDKIKATVQEKIGQQSGFLSPVLTVFLLAVLRMLPAEKEEEKPKRRTLTASEVEMVLGDGSEIDLLGPFSRDYCTGEGEFAKRLRNALVADLWHVFPEMPVVQVDPTAEVVSRIIDLYFGPNPFHDYSGRDGVSVDRRGHNLILRGLIDAKDGFVATWFPMGQINMIANVVSYQDPKRGRFTDQVPLAPQHQFSSAIGQALRRERRDIGCDASYEYGGWRIGWVEGPSPGYDPLFSGYCTPSRHPMTGRDAFGREVSF